MTKKFWIISLFNSCGGGYGSYYPSIWTGILPFHAVISFMFRRCDGGDMLVINASNNTGNSDYWVTSRRHTKMLSSERHLSDYPHLNRFLHHWPTVLWNSSLTDLSPGNNSQNECEGCTLSFKSAYRIYNVINNLRCFKENYHLKWDHSNKYAHEYGVNKL